VNPHNQPGPKFTERVQVWTVVHHTLYVLVVLACFAAFSALAWWAFR
jgi:hypothetical protein